MIQLACENIDDGNDDINKLKDLAKTKIYSKWNGKEKWIELFNERKLMIDPHWP